MIFFIETGLLFCDSIEKCTIDDPQNFANHLSNAALQLQKLQYEMMV